MIKKFKFLWILILCFIFTFVGSQIFAIVKPSKEFYVNDFASVLNNETKSYILNNSNALYEKTKAQIVVVTVDSLDGKSVEDYALELFRSWGIGEKKLNNGILLLLSTSDRKVRVEVGYGLEGRINDSKAGRFLDSYAVENFKNDDWNTGINNLYTALLSEVYKEYNLEVPSEVENVMKENSIEQPLSLTEIVVAIIIIIIVLIALVFLVNKYPWLGYLIAISSFRSGGNNGGKSGGFGGFSGGGGSSGGGGASRGF